MKMKTKTKIPVPSLHKQHQQQQQHQIKENEQIGAGDQQNLNSIITSENTRDKNTNTKSSKSTSADEKILEVDGSIQMRYTVKTRLGKGAYGIVWEAEELASGNNVALKKIFDAFRNDTDAQRTYREIIFLREFGSHPNIISLMNAHRASNNLDIYLIFPLMDSDLHKVIKNSPQMLKDSTIRRILYQILKGVKYLHSAEVVHRDLKPANILLDEYYNVKVGDFGLARSVYNDSDSEISSGCEKQGNNAMTDYVATRWYRPPEILLSCSRYSKAVDMWSLGCILAEMIRKKPIFPGNTTIEQIEIVMGIIEEPKAEEIEDLCTMTTKPMVDAALVYRKNCLGDIFEKCEFDTIDLIERLLVFHPNRRLTVEQTLSHSFLARFRNQSEETTMTHPVCPPLDDNIQLPLIEYRKAIYELIKVAHHGLIRLTTPKPSHIPISKSTIGMTSTSTTTQAQENKGKSVSVHTFPKKGISEVTAGLAGVRLTRRVGVTRDQDQDHLKVKNTRSSITFSTNNKGDQENNTSITVAAAPRQFKHRYHFTRTVEGHDNKPIPVTVENKTAKPMRRMFGWDHEKDGDDEYLQDYSGLNDTMWARRENAFEDFKIIEEETKNQSPKVSETYVPRSLLPVHTTISGCKRDKMKMPPKMSDYDSDLDLTVRPEDVKETPGYKKLLKTVDMVPSNHSTEDIPKKKEQIREKGAALNRAVNSISWMDELIKAKDAPKAQKVLEKFAGGDRNGHNSIPAVFGSNCTVNVPAPVIVAASRSREKGLGFGSGASRWEHNRPEERKPERGDNISPQMGMGRGRRSGHSRSRVSFSNNNPNKGKERAQIQHDLDMSTILQSWSAETKSSGPFKPQGQMPIPTPAYEVGSSAVSRSRQRYGNGSAYFPDGKTTHNINTNTNKDAKRQLPQTFYNNQRKPYDYSRSSATINASDLSQVINYGR